MGEQNLILSMLKIKKSFPILRDLEQQDVVQLTLQATDHRYHKMINALYKQY
jgi:hypothetical protein